MAREGTHNPLKPAMWTWSPAQVAEDFRYMAEHMVACLPWWEGSGGASAENKQQGAFDIVQKRVIPTTAVSAQKWTINQDGIAANAINGETAGFEYPDSAWVPTRNVSILFNRNRFTAGTKANHGHGVMYSADNQRCSWHTPWAGGGSSDFWDFGGASGSNRINHNAAVDDGNHTYLLTAGDRGMEWWRSDVGRGTTNSGVAVTRTATTTQNFLLTGNGPVGTAAETATYGIFAMFDYQLGDEEIELCFRDPYGVIRPAYEIGGVFHTAAAAGAAAVQAYHHRHHNLAG